MPSPIHPFSLSAGRSASRFGGVRLVEEENNRLDFEVYDNSVVSGVEYRGRRAPCAAADTLGDLRKNLKLYDKAKQYPRWIQSLVTQLIAAAPGAGLAQKFRWMTLVQDVHHARGGPFVGNTTEDGDPYGQPLTYFAYSPVAPASKTGQP